jgi:hypothetical protein
MDYVCFFFEIGKPDKVEVPHAAFEAKQPICRPVHYSLQQSVFSFYQ